MADPSVSDVQVVAKEFDANIDTGLTAQQASERLAANGPNALRSVPRAPAWRRMLRQFHDPLIYLLFGAIFIALLAWIIEGFAGWPVDAMVIAAIVLLNGGLGFAEEAKAQNAVAALARMTEANSSVLRDGAVKQVPSAELVRGDVLVLAEGDAVGADARLFQAANLHVPEASLTGESAAVVKDPATLAQAAALGDRLNMVFKGTAIAQGTGRAVITATGMDTEMGRIAELLEATVDVPTPLQIEVARLGRTLGLAVVVIAAVVVASILMMSTIRSVSDVIPVLLLGVSLAVAAVPEGLPAILSVVLALGVQRMAKHQAVVKKLSSVETLGSATVIASDKTGTLTKAEMTIERVITASGSTHISGVGYAPEGQVASDVAATGTTNAELNGVPNGAPKTATGASANDAPGAAPTGALLQEQIVVLGGGSLAGNASLEKAADGVWSIQGDPTEAAFLVAERKMDGDSIRERRERRFERVGEIPFTSERKLMSTIERDHEHQDELVLITKGAPDVLLGCCVSVRVGMATKPLDDTLRAKLLADVDSLTDAALRTLAVAYRPLAANEASDATQANVALERDLIFVGTVGIIDPPRPEAAAAIIEAKRAGIRVIMITGDHPRTAARIAQDLGIVVAGSVALTGAELELLDEPGFADAVSKTSVFARVAPAHKLRIVQALQAGGNVVAMTGDGVNDAPALKAADIGIAMGQTGTEVSKEAAKMILVNDDFATIVEAVREGRRVFNNIRKFLRYLLTSNTGEVLTVFLGVIGASVIGLDGAGGGQDGAHGGVVLPMLATQLLWINLVTDAAPALALGIDAPTDDLMARKPRRPGERLIDARMWTDVFLLGSVIALAALLTIDICLPGGLIEGASDLKTARTAGFTVLVFACLVQCFIARSDCTSAFSKLFSNPWLWGAITLSLVLQVAVVHLGFLNAAFGTAPLTPDQWLLCAVMASAVLWVSELRKFALRLWLRRKSAAAPPVNF
jgi:Ca2+-transporting ATPase